MANLTDEQARVLAERAGFGAFATGYALNLLRLEDAVFDDYARRAARGQQEIDELLNGPRWQPWRRPRRG